MIPPRSLLPSRHRLVHRRGPPRTAPLPASGVRFFLLLGTVAGLLLALPARAAAAPKPLTPEPAYTGICERLAQRLPRVHLLHLDMNDMVSSRTWTNLMTSLDFERLYFLQSDVARFQGELTQLDDKLKAGDMSFAFRTFAVFKERLSNRVEFVDQTLKDGFDFTQQESYAWQRKDAPWARDEAEWNDLWRRKIKNEYLRLLIAREQEKTGRAAAATNAATTNAAAIPDTPAAAATNAAGGATTNAVTPPASTAAAPATGAVVRVEAPEEVISKRYRQLRMVIEDSDAESVLQRYLNAFTQSYDPHSSYFTPTSMQDFQIEMNLSLFGIGALLSAEDGAAKIVRLIPGGPAARDTRDKRLQPGDKIVAVAQGDEAPVDVLHWPLNKIVGKIRGEKGSRVVLTVIPASDPSGTLTKTVDLIRDEVKLEDEAAKSATHTLTDTNGVSRKLGIIRLPAFYGNMQVRSPDEPGFRSAAYDVLQLINNLKKEPIDGLLLDLRNNGGGALVEAVDLTGLFIRRGPTVQVKERFTIRPLEDADPRVQYDGPLVVLVNRLSASASEILAGALQDYGRAIIIGDSKTHGKGTVQSVINLGNDDSQGSLKVTTASYIRITGASTQLQGVQPDIVVPSPWDFMEYGEEYLPNPVPWSQETPTPFRRVADLGVVIPQLREQSESRRRSSTDFKTYARFLERIAQMNASRLMPLNLEERRALAATERELSELQERLAAEQDGEGSTNGIVHAGDLVLAEGLAILANYVSLLEAAEGEAAKTSEHRPRPPATPL